MTPTPEGDVIRSAETLVADYEELRAAALERNTGRERGIGFSLFIRRGMAGWIAVCDSIVPQRQAQASRPERLVPASIGAEAAVLLAHMALSVHAGGGMQG